MVVQYELDLKTKDWGYANFNPMVRAWGLKKDRRAKCKSCVRFVSSKCEYRFPFEHSADFMACTRYKNKNRK